MMIKATPANNPIIIARVFPVSSDESVVHHKIKIHTKIYIESRHYNYFISEGINGQYLI
uniref:Uncharacterized protein n=1 Tax=Nelumbo nucifera TaxID=4432 RepID=A0A822YUH9_NELNU|nr:TPA_asm: hypothetical protein HUJ06_006393 [Nelumbo nucifera]